MRKTKTYYSWVNMKTRCLNPLSERYADYGGRGITVCERWKSYDNFLADLGEKPEGKTLERKYNDLGYFLENCSWATPQEQALNRRNRKVTNQPRIDNKAGIRGVYLLRRNMWEASGKFKKARYRLYQGGDFFEACCRRKSWENSLKYGELT